MAGRSWFVAMLVLAAGCDRERAQRPITAAPESAKLATPDSTPEKVTVAFAALHQQYLDLPDAGGPPKEHPLDGTVVRVRGKVVDSSADPDAGWTRVSLGLPAVETRLTCAYASSGPAPSVDQELVIEGRLHSSFKFSKHGGPVLDLYLRDCRLLSATP